MHLRGQRRGACRLRPPSRPNRAAGDVAEHDARDSIRAALKELVVLLIQVTGKLPDLPAGRQISMHLQYYDDRTPVDYRTASVPPRRSSPKPTSRSWRWARSSAAS